jgi:hypothetical protein
VASSGPGLLAAIRWLTGTKDMTVANGVMLSNR